MKNNSGGGRVVPGQNAGRVLWKQELHNSVEDVFEVREKVDREVDSIGGNWRERRINIHVNELLIIMWLQVKQLMEVHRVTNHIVDCKCVIIDIIHIQFYKGGSGNHWEAGSNTAQEQICRWEVANVKAVVVA